MSSVNKVILIGNLTKDPELRSLQNGSCVTKFGVATNRSWRDSQGNKTDEVEFHNVVIWGKLAEIAAQYLRKGAKAYFEGRLKTNSWEDKDTHQKKYSTEIIVENMTMLGSKRDGNGEGYQNHPDDSAGQSAPAQGEVEVNLDDIPF